MFNMKHKSFVSGLLVVFLTTFIRAQTAKPAASPTSVEIARKGVEAAKAGHCQEALQLLKKATAGTLDKDLKRSAGFAGVRCGMLLHTSDAAMYFLQYLNHEFPGDPDVLYVSVHTYSDLSTRASLQLARTAPTSAQAHQLNGEALEVQGKWDDAEKEYRYVLEQNPGQVGIHYRLGRVLVSKPGFGPEAADQAEKQFEEELQIDPSNAGAEYILGLLAKQKQQMGDAIGHFSRATKLDAEFADAFLALGATLLGVKQYTEAIPPLENAVRLQPDNPDAHYNLAQVYEAIGKPMMAFRHLQIYRKLLERDN
jgi:tetratricopeptide (TPR) repeat protein